MDFKDGVAAILQTVDNLEPALEKIRNDILVRTLAADILSSLVENEVQLALRIFSKSGGTLGFPASLCGRSHALFK